MKAKSFVLALLSVFALSTFAQEYQPQIGYSTENGSKTNFKKNKAGDNWFITLGVGGNVLFGDDNSKADFGDRINIAPQIAFGKWYNPYWGTRLQLNGGPMKSFVDPNGESELKAYWLNPHIDIMWDITNYWAPYKESKVFRFIPFAGVGYAVRSGKTVDVAGTSTSKAYKRSESPSINLGAIMSFRLSKRVDLNIEGQYVLLGEHFNRVSKGHETDRVGQVTAGLNFKLGKTNFEVLQPMDYALLNDLNSQINALRSENDELSKRPVSCPECEEVPAPVIVKNIAENVVYFRINSSKIDKNQQINIFNTAEFMKNNSSPIKVIGYADKDTGSSKYNLGLSEKRARAVAKELIDTYGISSNQITIEWKGSDEQPYDKNNWNRVVIMRAND